MTILKVRDDPIFRREGSDIHVDAVLSITQVTTTILYTTYLVRALLLVCM